MELRRYIPSDFEQIAKLFYDTVHSINTKDYTEEQLNAWAPGKVNLQEWDRLFSEHLTYVAVESRRIIGFGDIDSSGHLDKLFVHKNFQGIGIATAICDRFEKEMEVPKITVHASISANFSLKKEDTK